MDRLDWVGEIMFNFTSVLMILVSATFIQHKPFSFAVIGDTQIHPHIFKKATNSIKKHKPNFVVHLGDLWWCSSYYWWKNYRKLIRKTKLDWEYVIGNHELVHCNPFMKTPTRYKWKNFWRRKKYRHSTLKIFDRFGYRFILMDSSTNHTPWRHIPRIARALKSAKDKRVFLFSHKPLPYNKPLKLYYGPNRKHWHWYWVMSGLGWYGRNKALWRTIYKYRNKIKYFFHGHYHAFRKYSLSGINAFCTGGGGGRLETKYDYYHYLIVKVRNGNASVKVIRL